MRPLKLTISAFGPYAEKQEIDFNDLEGQNIFLITGPTGAGKTTIFDAISFALFGVASGSIRENDSLRSDFAKDDVETFVELEFEFRGESYLVKRAPQQIKKKKRGEGFTSQAAEAELSLPDGKIITKYSAVTEKIEEILGINKDQFKQIVMLPQGEFKKLLLADSKDREAIFRKIFGTYDYQAIQMKLKDKASSLKQEVDKKRNEVGSNLRGIKVTEPVDFSEYEEFKVVLNKVEEIIKKDKDTHKDLESNLSKIRKEKEKLNEKLIKGEGTNALIEEKEATILKLNSYLEMKDEISDKENILKLAKKALEVEVLENNYLEKLKNKEKKTQDLKNINDEFNLKELEIAKVKKNLDIEIGKEEIRNDLSNEILLLKDKLIKISKVEEKQRLINNLELSYKQAVKNIDTLKNVRLENQNEKNIKEEELKVINELEKEVIHLDTKIIEKEKTRQELLDIHQEVKTYNQFIYEYNNLVEDFKLQEIKYKKIKDEYEELEMNFRKGQAGILAETLVSGIECPVCGSKEHPTPAIKPINVPREDELKIEKEKYELIKKETDDCLANIKFKKEKIDIKKNEVIIPLINKINSKLLINLSLNDKLLEEIKEIGTFESSELNKLKEKKLNNSKTISEKEKIKKRVEELQIEFTKVEKEIEKLENERVDSYGKLQGETQGLKELIEEMPPNITSANELNAVIANKEKNLLEMKKVFEDIKALELRLSKEYSVIKGSMEATKNILKELTLEVELAEVNYEKKLIECSFNSVDEYKKYKKSSDEITKIEEYIVNYKETLKSLKDKSEDIITKTKDLKKIDLLDLKDSMLKYINEEKELEKILREVYSRIDNNNSRYKLIKELSDKVIELEEKYKILGELANLSNGRQSPYITFESYVLAAYFQEIIDAANVRLIKMTGERFMLRRKEDKGKGTGQKGLELEVYDNYTGKLRHVKTLSGGESFKASLALALGLSDIIQAASGGIKLDTMFVDEGFGTLDPESLDNAISCLLDLQRGGRLVGVISHVPELKERVEKKIEIILTSEGSLIKFKEKM